MKWILIYALMSAAGGLTSGNVEFNTEKACRDAADDMRDNFKPLAAPFCVAKGADPVEDPASVKPPTPAAAPTVAKPPKASP